MAEERIFVYITHDQNDNQRAEIQTNLIGAGSVQIVRASMGRPAQVGAPERLVAQHLKVVIFLVQPSQTRGRQAVLSTSWRRPNCFRRRRVAQMNY